MHRRFLAKAPVRQGLYDPANEHDSCGIGFVADLKGRPSAAIIAQGLELVVNLTHRGAVGADPTVGDGVGLLMQVPDALFRAATAEAGFTLPDGPYGVGQIFLPRQGAARTRCEEETEAALRRNGLTVFGWRDVPVDRSVLSDVIRAGEPLARQVFVGLTEEGDQDTLERRLFIARKQLSNAVRTFGPDCDSFYVVSMSSRTICYKGMMLPDALGPYYLDLQDPRTASALALVHQRFSTNTFPSWQLAQPFRMLCHNGEINTVRGNCNWMAARRHALRSHLLGKDLETIWPLISEGQSDSACLDNALEFLLAGGYSLSHALALLVPEAWQGHPGMSPGRRAFYERHAVLMEPWDGPAALAFTDGRQIGGLLDRNGLRPSRYVVTRDDRVILASEAGVLAIPERDVIASRRLEPGRILLLDLEEGRIVGNDEVKDALAGMANWAAEVAASTLRLSELPTGIPPAPTNVARLDRQQTFGYTQEDLSFLMMPMAATGAEAVGSMGTDTPLAALSGRAKLLYQYFKQNFAQVTNPAIDPIREQMVMSLITFVGPRPNLLGLGEPDATRRIRLEQPILTDAELARITALGADNETGLRVAVLDMTFDAAAGEAGLADALAELRGNAEQQVRAGITVLVLSDRAVGPDRIPVPALLATSAVHSHLIRRGLRTSTGLLVETGEAREVHHFCVLAGYGAEAVNPYLAFETLAGVCDLLPGDVSAEEASAAYITAVGKGILKVMSKMGISTYQSYCGAQIFDAVGLASGFVDEYFPGTATAVEGVDLPVIAAETVARHRAAFGNAAVLRDALEAGGEYAFRLRGEEHMWTPDTVADLQHAVRTDAQDRYDAFSAAANSQAERARTLRGLFTFRPAGAIPLDEVEPAADIVKRFATGAMSFGSISREAHTTLAIAMNRIGGKSNTGEGGEDPERYVPDPNGDLRRSAIKQVASGRFGVTSEYLTNADDLQIKMAQGAKPGEGGQLPGPKVWPWIAKTRHSTPGVGLISPPPHHDIYSIEDLKQLIHDLKNSNPAARVHVKLVAEVGVGTVAAGVSKAKADVVLISGHDGGTGASPLTSLKHAGAPWELGLAETQQTLLLNGLRDRIVVQTDGQLKTGRDVIVAALLGAEEYGFATAPLVVSGCIMMRVCHLDTCPVGVATQNRELRKRFGGRPEFVVNYFEYIAQEVREYLAMLGLRSLPEAIGRVDRLDTTAAVAHWKAHGLNLSPILAEPETPWPQDRYCSQSQDHGLEQALDQQLIELAAPAIRRRELVRAELPISNVNRTVGTMLGHRITAAHGGDGLPDDTVDFTFNGSAGQSFGAFVPRGLTMRLYGDANDYLGKGLSGGRLVVRPSRDTHPSFVAEDNIIAGNVILYGATGGEAYIRGTVGERFCVRNSGATAVVEGVGDHACEYMTGGMVVVLGAVGRNFGAGMSGGAAFVYDPDDVFWRNLNAEMVDLEPQLDDADAETVRAVLRHHLAETDSAPAGRILGRWHSEVRSFRKVMPKDYRRVLEARAAAAELGQDPDEAVMAAAHG
ncbi:MAG: glutamate synthase large subunit [Acidimicrobiaceae bacterium]|nr:glutamate synthase large subunit [Acidimicrobiaceae bacterium]